MGYISLIDTAVFILGLANAVIWSLLSMVVLAVTLKLVGKVIRNNRIEEESVFDDVRENGGVQGVFEEVWNESVEEGCEEYDEGLTVRDKEVFNEVKGDLEGNIVKIIEDIEKSSKLRYIMGSKDRLKAIELYYQSLKRNPERLIESKSFVHDTIPYMEGLMGLYTKLEQEEIKSKELEEAIGRTLSTIEDLADEIVVEYKGYLDIYIEEVDREVSKVDEYLLSKRK